MFALAGKAGFNLLCSLVYAFKSDHIAQLLSIYRDNLRAHSHNPGEPEVGDVLYFAGRQAETLSFEQKAIRLDPRNADWYVIDIGYAYDVMGQYAKALPFLKQHEARYPDNIGVHLELTFAYAQLGRSEARAKAAEVMRLNPRFSLKDAEQGPFKDQASNQRCRAAWRRADLK
jgi:tetratricopeptide (TPR) repeat protein